MIRIPAVLAIVALTANCAHSQEDPVETRVYDVGALTFGVADQHEPGLGLPSNTIGTNVLFDTGVRSKFSGESLVELVKAGIGAETWGREGVGISCSNNQLSVTNLRSVQEKVREFLACECDPRRRTVTVDAAIVALEPALFAKIRAAGGDPERPMALSPGQAKQVMDAAREGKLGEVVKTCSFTALDGQDVSVQDVVRTTYVRDFDSQIATFIGVLDPVVDDFATGTSFIARPYVDPAGKMITLDICAEVADPEGVAEKTLKLRKENSLPKPAKDGEKSQVSPFVDVQEAGIQLPRISRRVVRTTLAMKNGETTIVGSALHRGREVVFLLTPSLAAPDRKPFPGLVSKEGRQGRLHDISFLNHRLQDYPGPMMRIASDLSIFARGPLAGASFTLDEPKEGWPGEGQLVDLIKEHAAPGTWGEGGNVIEKNLGGLCVWAQPGVLGEVERALQRLVAERSRMVTTEAVVLAFPKGTPAPGDSIVEPEILEKLMETKEVRLLGKGEVTSFPLQRVYAGSLQEEGYIMDYEPQVSSRISMYDPVIGTHCNGFLLDVRALPRPGGGQVLVDLNAALVQRELGEREMLFYGLGPVQTPHGTGLHWGAEVTCVGGKWTMVNLETRGSGEGAEDVAFFLRARVNAVR